MFYTVRKMQIKTTTKCHHTPKKGKNLKDQVLVRMENSVAVS